MGHDDNQDAAGTTGAGRPSLVAPPRRAAVVCALAAVGPLATVVIGCKVHKLARLEVDALGVLAGVGPDLAVMGVLLAATAWAFGLTRGRGRVLRVSVHLVALGLTLLAAVEHAFFITTGGHLDGHLLAYGIRHFDALSGVYASELDPGLALAALALTTLHIAPLWLVGLRPLEDPPATHAGWRRRPATLWAAALVALVLVGVASASAPLPAIAEPARGNVFVNLVADAAAEHAEPTADLPAAPEPLVLDARPDAPRPNVLIVILESARAASTTPYADDLPTTPHLARLAERGALVERAWATVPHTSKALVSILCGLHPRLDTEITEAGPEGLPAPCLARLLRDRGWATAFFQPATAHFERRDQLVANMGYAHFVSRETLDGGGFDESSYFGFEDRAMLDPALAWVDAQASEPDRPFFLTVLTLASHHKYTVPSRWPREELAAHPALDDYLNAIAYVDDFLGALLDGLDARGLLDDTVVVVVGDHGEGFGEHGRYQHDTVIYEEGLWVPLVLAGPGVAPGQRVGGLRQHVDIAPTVLELTGAPVRSGLPGESLLSSDGHERVFASCWYRRRCMALREGDLKFIHHFDHRAPEAFDLAADPDEREDLVAAGRLSDDRIAALTEALAGFKATADARYDAQLDRFRRDFITTLPPRPERRVDVRFGDLVRLVGVDASSTRILEGEPLTVTFHFESLAPLGDRWRLFTHVVGRSDGARPFFNADHVPVNGRHPTSAWRPGRFIADIYRLQPRRPLPPGRYTVMLGLWDAEATGDAAATRALPRVVGEAPREGVTDDRRVAVLDFEVVARRGSWGFGQAPAPQGDDGAGDDSEDPHHPDDPEAGDE